MGAKINSSVIDIHVHIGGAGHGGTGCMISEAMQKRLAFRLLRRRLKIKEDVRKTCLDQTLKAHLFAALDSAPSLAKAVVLAFDKAYLPDGSVDEPVGLYVPNDYVVRLSKEHPKILFGASVHPDRPGALEELQRCVDLGAVLLKWLPGYHRIDPRQKRYKEFYRKMADLDLPLLVHTGSEFVLPVDDPMLNHPQPLIAALEEGVRVIAAHCGTTSTHFHPDYMRDVIAMMHRYPNLYGDCSALASHRGAGFLKAFGEAGLLERVVHGSDYPIPPTPAFFALKGVLSIAEARRLSKLPSQLEADIQTKRALGYPSGVFDLGASIIRRAPDRQNIS